MNILETSMNIVKDSFIAVAAFSVKYEKELLDFSVKYALPKDVLLKILHLLLLHPVSKIKKVKELTEDMATFLKAVNNEIPNESLTNLIHDLLAILDPVDAA